MSGPSHALLAQLLAKSEQPPTSTNNGTGNATAAATAATNDEAPFTQEEAKRIRELVATSNPKLESLLQQSSLSVRELTDQLRSLLRTPATESSSTSAGASNDQHAPTAAASSSASASPSSTSTSTNAPSSSSATAASQSSTSSTSSGQPSQAMEEDDHKESDPPASVQPAAAAPAASQPSSSPMDVDSSGGSSDGPAYLRTQIRVIGVEQKKNAEGVLRHLSKMLAAVKKSPSLLATRKFRADNIAVKKFIMDVTGALAIAKYVGYKTVELTDKKTPYLVVEEAHLATPEGKRKLDEAIEAVNEAVAVYDAPPGAAAAAATAAPAVRKECLGGCGFWGSSETEGYCSLCFKKKFLSSAGPLSPAKAAGPGANPFVTPPRASAAGGASAAAAAAGGGVSSLSLGASPMVGGEAKCLKHCGRYAAKDKKGFCEECFEKITAQGQKPLPPRWKCLFDGAMVKLRAVHRFNQGKKPIQTARNRCWVCQKKVGITGFECRCRYIFCAQHRYMEQHACSYDIKGLHRRKLQKENEEIRAAKIIKL